jgi:DNA-directed RNA polymerase subunit RPC12/RpoP
MFTRIVAEIKFLRMYTCVRCGKQQQGDTERMSIDAGYVPDITVSAARIPLNPHHMPVEWASYTDGIRCPECKS